MICHILDEFKFDANAQRRVSEVNFEYPDNVTLSAWISVEVTLKGYIVGVYFPKGVYPKRVSKSFREAMERSEYAGYWLDSKEPFDSVTEGLEDISAFIRKERDSNGS